MTTPVDVLICLYHPQQARTLLWLWCSRSARLEACRWVSAENVLQNNAKVTPRRATSRSRLWCAVIAVITESYWSTSKENILWSRTSWRRNVISPSDKFIRKKKYLHYNCEPCPSEHWLARGLPHKFSHFPIFVYNFDLWALTFNACTDFFLLIRPGSEGNFIRELLTLCINTLNTSVNFIVTVQGGTNATVLSFLRSPLWIKHQP